MRITEVLTESSKICPQCGMRGCPCKPGKCNCKPKPGYPKKIDEAANPAQQAAIAISKKKEQGIDEGLSGAIQGGLMGGVAGALLVGPLAAIAGAYWGPVGAAYMAYKGSIALGTALAAWAGSKVQDNNKKFREKNVFSVHLNGDRVSPNNLNHDQASVMIAKLAGKDHNPETNYTIFDNEQDKIVWRFKINDNNEEDLDEDWNKVNKSDKTSGMSRKAVKAYRRENPGSNPKPGYPKKIDEAANPAQQAAIAIAMKKAGKKPKSVAEGFPQPGPSSGAPKQFGPDAKIQTRQMTVTDIISSVPGVPYYNNVVDDWDAKKYNSWGVTKKVIEYATYLKNHPESLAKLPPAIVLNGKFEDGAHRVSAIWLLQQRMDPKNPLWKNAKLNVQFVKQGVAEGSNEPTSQLGPQLYTPHPKNLDESMKPKAALWTSTASGSNNGYTSAWVRWAKSEMPQWLGHSGFLYDVSPSARILTINSDQDAMRVANKYGMNTTDIMDLFMYMPWKKIAKDYDAIHHVPSNRGADLFMHSWDVESTAWFNTKMLLNKRKVPILVAKQGVAEGSQEINWVKPNFDFEWHEVEEQSRMKQVPVDVRQYYQKHFPNKDAWLKAVQNGKAVVVPPDHAYEIRNAPFDKASLQKVLAPTGHEGPIGPAKEKRVNDLFDKGQVEMPIILKTSQGLWLIGGKTRLGTANYVKGLPAKVWLISGEQGVAEVINPMTANTSGAGAGMMASYQARENQPVAERHIQDYMEEARS